MSGYWVYKGVVKRCINGRIEIFGRVSDRDLAYWRLFHHGKS